MYKAFALLLLTVALAGCNAFGAGKVSDNDVQKILYPQLVEMLAKEGKDTPQLIDVRMHEKFVKGHIPGAINIPMPQIKPKHPQIHHKRPIIVYSGSWTDGFSATAAKKLLQAGYDGDKVYDFRGGLDYWIKEGGRVVTD